MRFNRSVKLFRKAAEVVDRARLRHRGDARLVSRHPVGADAEDRFRGGKLLPERLPGLRERVVFDRVHRAAMADEEGGHPFGGGELCEVVERGKSAVS